MANPDRYISIADFRPGIWGDLQAAVTARSTAADDLQGYIAQNGAAQVDGTKRCHADKNGALVPLPKATYTSESNLSDSYPNYDDSATMTVRHGRYLLDAQIGADIPAPDQNQQNADAIHPEVYIIWGIALQIDATFFVPMVRGRVYRRNTTANYVGFDFLTARTIFTTTQYNPLSSLPPLPAGSLCNTRFYYGYTSSGVIEAGSDFSFRARWWYPVTVAVVSAYGSGEDDNQRVWKTGAIGADATSIPANAPNPGTGAPVQPYTYYPPAIGGRGEGPCLIGMNFNNGDTTHLPLSTETRKDIWYWHYNDAAHVHGTDLGESLHTPYMVVAHQQRIVMPDRKRSRKRASEYVPGTGATLDDIPIDDMLWFSEAALPMQDFSLTVLPNTWDYAANDVGPGLVNNGYQSVFPAVVQNAYNKMTVADDLFSVIGVIGVVNYDQLLVVKQTGGGVVVAGDLESPQIRRLPYIEPTGGLIMKGCATPLGFVYGSPNGIFVWQGGEQTQKLSPQLDGFFWDHTDGVDNEYYSGARGRFVYWNGMVCVPNNYIYDIESQGWWRLDPHLDANAPSPSDAVANTAYPFNAYDTWGRKLFAFPYKAGRKTGGDASNQPLWLEYDPLMLDDRYTWHSHPLVETRGRSQTFQDIIMVVTGHEGAAASIKVTLTGFDQRGVATKTVDTIFVLAATERPQELRQDIKPNFTAEYVTIHLDVKSNSNSIPAPKIHSINLGVKDAGITPRHG